MAKFYIRVGWMGIYRKKIDVEILKSPLISENVGERNEG